MILWAFGYNESMSEENNNIKNASEKLGKNPSLSKDFETWLAMDEERTHLNTQAQLADLMNSLEPEQNPPNRD